MNREQIEDTLNDILDGMFPTQAMRDIVRIAYLRGHIDGIREARATLRPDDTEQGITEAA